MELSLATFAAMTIFFVITPGPTVLLALSNGSRFGFGPASYGIFGAACSDAVLITAAALGLGALLATSAVLFSVVKAIGVVYLIWIGVQMLRSSGRIGTLSDETTHIRSGSTVSIFRKSFLVAVTNPKGYLFFTAFLPQFLAPSEPVLPQYATLAVVFIAIDVAVMAAYAALGSRAVKFLSNKGTLWLDRICGAFLIILGFALALVRRGNV